MISRAGSTTLVTGIEVFPFGSLIWPSGPGGGGAVAGAITAVGTDADCVLPARFVAVTAARIVWPTSAAVSW